MRPSLDELRGYAESAGLDPSELDDAISILGNAPAPQTLEMPTPAQPVKMFSAPEHVGHVRAAAREVPGTAQDMGLDHSRQAKQRSELETFAQFADDAELENPSDFDPVYSPEFARDEILKSRVTPSMGRGALAGFADYLTGGKANAVETQLKSYEDQSRVNRDATETRLKGIQARDRERWMDELAPRSARAALMSLPGITPEFAARATNRDVEAYKDMGKAGGFKMPVANLNSSTKEQDNQNQDRIDILGEFNDHITTLERAGLQSEAQRFAAVMRAGKKGKGAGGGGSGDGVDLLEVFRKAARQANPDFAQQEAQGDASAIDAVAQKNLDAYNALKRIDPGRAAGFLSGIALSADRMGASYGMTATKEASDVAGKTADRRAVMKAAQAAVLEFNDLDDRERELISMGGPASWSQSSRVSGLYARIAGIFADILASRGGKAVTAQEMQLYAPGINLDAYTPKDGAAEVAKQMVKAASRDPQLIAASLARIEEKLRTEAAVYEDALTPRGKSILSTQQGGLSGGAQTQTAKPRPTKQAMSTALRRLQTIRRSSAQQAPGNGEQQSPRKGSQ